MVWRIVRKELLVNLLSARFALGLLITVAMMGLVGYVLMGDYAQRRQQYIDSVQQHEEELRHFKVYSTIEVHADIPPSPLSIFSRPLGDLATSFRVSPFHLPSLVGGEAGSYSVHLDRERPSTENPLLRVFSTIDLTFVIYALTGLLCVLLVFDSFSGEREQGTLPMIMACPVGRLELLAGKFLGGLISVAVPLTLSFLVVLTMWGLSPAVDLNGAVWAGTAAIYLASLLYLAGFLALGLLLSLCAEESSQALVLLLLAWVLMVVAIPEGGGYLAQYARPQVSRQRFTEEMKRAEAKFHEKYTGATAPFAQGRCRSCDAGGGQLATWYMSSSSSSGGHQLLTTSEEEMQRLVATYQEGVPLQLDFTEERYRVAAEYEQALRRWRQLQELLVLPSLAAQYRQVVRALASTDVESYGQVLEQMRRYRDQLVSYVRPTVATPQWFTRMSEYPELVATPENQAKWERIGREEGWQQLRDTVFNWEGIPPLDLSAMPRLRVTYRNLGERAEGVVGVLLLTVASTGALLALAAWRVLRFPLR